MLSRWLLTGANLSCKWPAGMQFVHPLANPDGKTPAGSDRSSSAHPSRPSKSTHILWKADHLAHHEQRVIVPSFIFQTLTTMNRSIQEKYREILLHQLDENSSDRKNLRGKFRDHKRPDPGDDADIESETGDFVILDKLNQFEHLEKREIELALKRLDDGSFGICSGCAEEIAPARLEVKPYAIFCVKCQSAQDADSATRNYFARNDNAFSMGNSEATGSDDD